MADKILTLLAPYLFWIIIILFFFFIWLWSYTEAKYIERRHFKRIAAEADKYDSDKPVGM